jgi:hypothetical protein
LFHFSFLVLGQSVGFSGRVISPTQGRYLTQTQNKHKPTSMSRVEFDLTIPVFERAETVHDLDRAATVIGISVIGHGDIIESLVLKFNESPSIDLKGTIIGTDKRTCTPVLSLTQSFL